MKKMSNNWRHRPMYAIMYNGNVKQLFTLNALVMRNLSNDVTRLSYFFFHIIEIHEDHEKTYGGIFPYSSSGDLLATRGYFSTTSMIVE